MTTRGPFEAAAVFGAGAVGSFIGARLSTVVPTVLVARGLHATGMEADGLRLSGTVDERATPVVARSLPPVEGRALVVVAVKALSLSAAAQAIADAGEAPHELLCIQNGLHPDAELVRQLRARGVQARAVMRAITNTACNLAEPGVVEYWGGGFVFPEDPGHDDVAELFAAAGLEVRRSADFESEVWTKLAVNCVVNPLCALLARRNNEITVRELASLRHAVCDEVARCARARGVDVRPDLAEWVDRALSSSLNRNSMLQDIAYGRRTEIDELNGWVDEASREARRGAPANRTLARLVRFLQEKAAGRAVSRRP